MNTLNVNGNAVVTADLVDAHGDHVKSCAVQFRQFGGRLRFFGPVRTVKTFEDNALIKQILATPGDGAVLASMAMLHCAVRWWAISSEHRRCSTAGRG